MDMQIDNDDLVEAIRDDDQLMEDLADRLVVKMQDGIREQVREAFDYHQDQFRLGWMRMMEAELGELVNSHRSGDHNIACNHGQQVFDGIFHAIREYVSGEGNNWMKEALGIDGLPQTIAEVASAAVIQRIKPVWAGSGYTVDARPIMATIGEPQPAFANYVSPAHTDEDVERNYSDD